MVKATRRVKRVKRSKKQVHRARDRKTNRRHKTNRRRYTRRQRGGAIIKVCEKTHTGFFKNESNASGIDITYDVQTNMFKIGTQSTISDLETFNGKKRYERAVRVLRHIYDEDESTQLNWYYFAQFANMYCYKNAADPQCAQITGFVNHYKDENNEDGKIVDTKSPVADRTIQTSIEQGEKQANNKTNNRFKQSLDSSGASAAPVAADVPSTCRQAHVEKKGVPNSLILTQTPSCIAYINHAKLVELQTLTSKPTYVFENFTIPLHDETVIAGTLTINLATRSFELILDLNGRENTNTPAFIDCMKGLTTVTDVKRKSTFISKDKLTVNGTVELEKKDDALFVSNFQTFVTEFAEQYKFCTTPVGQNLENAEEINRSDAGALVILIKGKIKTLDTKMPSDTEYKKLKQEFEEFIKPHEGSRMDSTTENLDVLNRIHDKLKIMKPPTSEELSDRLAALTID